MIRLLIRCVRLPLLTGALLASGCQLLSPDQPVAVGAMATNEQLANWAVRGRIGIRLPDTADSAYLNWQHCGEREEIRLSGPLGQGAAQLFSQPGSAMLQLASGEQHWAPDASTLLAGQLGWPVPLASLGYWVRGLPAPAPGHGQQKVALFRTAGKSGY